MTTAISIENLGKRYSIGHKRANGDGLRHAIERAVREPLAWLQSRRQEKVTSQDFWALRDVSFQINSGEVVGIIGRNGAGKSTLLKLLSRITIPTEGRIRIDGRVASLLEVGTGFHQELTGRENIFLNGAILGMTRVEIIRKFDEIVAFSEIEEFLDTPVKRYSSGMYVRLAFAVAAHLEPEILIVDEVLAVGDAAFQKKCLGKMGTFAQSGRTVLFVSHNMEAVRSLCQRGIWMKSGRLHRDGHVNEVVDAYFDDPSDQRSLYCENPEYGLVIQKVVLRNRRGQECLEFRPGDDLVVEISYGAQRRIEKPILALGVLGATGSCFTSNMLLDGHRPEFLEGSGQIRCTFKSIPLLPQNYTVKMSIRADSVNDLIIPYQDVAGFNVVGNLADYGYKGDFLQFARHSTPVVVPYEWQLPDGRTVAVALDGSTR
ncbi:MAG: lipopolysaccharide transport system ATP-binding protein [Acidobacteriaceae bacterium]|jgi:lipopolysaccharide transport system ATP-binding protein|nr:lipopolysaccharide transport system ATP-binding protein [Acidobacteriaceae bacterium]